PASIDVGSVCSLAHFLIQYPEATVKVTLDVSSFLILTTTISPIFMLLGAFRVKLEFVCIKKLEATLKSGVYVAVCATSLSIFAPTSTATKLPLASVERALRDAFRSLRADWENVMLLRPVISL